MYAHDEHAEVEVVPRHRVVPTPVELGLSVTDDGLVVFRKRGGVAVQIFVLVGTGYGRSGLLYVRVVDFFGGPNAVAHVTPHGAHALAFNQAEVLVLVVACEHGIVLVACQFLDGSFVLGQGDLRVPTYTVGSHGVGSQGDFKALIEQASGVGQTAGETGVERGIDFYQQVLGQLVVHIDRCSQSVVEEA